MQKQKNFYKSVIKRLHNIQDKWTSTSQRRIFKWLISIKRGLNLVIGEMKIKTTLTYHYTYQND